MFKTILNPFWILLLSSVFVLNSVAQSSAKQKDLANSLFQKGKYFEASLFIEKHISVEKDFFQKARLYKKLAECNFLLPNMEAYKRNIDSSHHYHLLVNKQEDIYTLEHFVDQIRYENFYIMPYYTAKKIVDLNRLMLKFRNEFHLIKSYKANESVATLHRNLSQEIVKMEREIEQARKQLYADKASTLLDKATFYKSKGNIYLDKITPDSKNYLKLAIEQYDIGISYAHHKDVQNIPLSIGFKCLKGLAYHMGGEFSNAKKEYDKAFELVELAKKQNYRFENYQFIYFDLLSWSSWTTDRLYKKSHNIQQVKNDLVRLKQAVSFFENYAAKNKKVGMDFFYDKYHNAPYNAIVANYHKLYAHTQNKAYIDTALYFAEKSKVGWLNESTYENLDLSQFVKRNQVFVKQGNAIVFYSEQPVFGLSTLYIIIHSSKGKFFIKQANTTNFIPLFNIEFDNLSVQNFQQASFETYETVFKPVEKYLDERDKYVLVIPSKNLARISFDGLITDTIKSWRENPFLIAKYRINQQPSVSLALKKSKKYSTNNVSLFTPDYSNSKLSKISFTQSLFRSILENKNHLNDILNSKPSKLLLLSAHCLSDANVVSKSAILTSNGKISIQQIIASKLNSELAVLAMCNAGNGETFGDDTKFSFSSAFINAGVNSCVYNIWLQDDKTASITLGYFLANLKQGMSKRDALHEAKLNYLKNVKSDEELHPFYWSGIQLIGNTDAIYESNSRISIWKIVIPVSVILLLIFLYVRKVRLKKH